MKKDALAVSSVSSVLSLVYDVSRMCKCWTGHAVLGYTRRSGRFRGPYNYYTPEGIFKLMMYDLYIEICESECGR